MRHRVARRKLNRTSEHREALRRNMAQSLFEHGQIRTTVPKAKDVRSFVERCITLARKASKGNLAARQRLLALMGDRAMIPADNQETYEDMSNARRDRVLRARSNRRHRLGQARGGQQFTAVSIVHHLITNVAPQFEDRPGGYTRVIQLGKTQKGDNAPLAVLQLVGQEESPGTVTRPEKTARKRRSERRYQFAAKVLKEAGKAAPKEQAEVPAEEQAPPEPEAQAEDAPVEEASPEEAPAEGDEAAEDK